MWARYWKGFLRDAPRAKARETDRARKDSSPVQAFEGRDRA